LRSRNNRGARATIILAYSVSLHSQLRTSLPSEGPVPPIGHNWAIDNGFSPARESTRTDIARPTTKVNSARPARFRESHSTIRTTFAAPDLSVAAVAHSEVMTSNIHHARNGSRHFCAAGTFCASFRHAMMLPATCVTESGITFHARQNNVVRNLPQMFLIAAGNEARV